MAMVGILGMLLPLLFSGPVGNDLLDYVDTAVYWSMKGVAITETAMQRELVTSPKKPGNVKGLIKDLGSSSFRKREAATLQLKAIGEPALPELKKAAASDDVEVSTRARKLVKELSIPTMAKKIRKLMALRAIGEMEFKNSLPMLKKLAMSKDFFTADYAKAAIAAIEGREYKRAGATNREMESDLACLPTECSAVAQVRVTGGKPMDFTEIIKKMQEMMEKMGAPPDEMPDIKQQVAAAVLQVAELTGNIRITGATAGIDGDIGDDVGFVAVVVRGVCDDKAIRAALNRMGVGERVVEGIPLFTPEDEMCFGPVSSSRFVASFGPDQSELPIERIVKSAKAARPKLQLNKELMAQIKQLDTKKELWAAVVMTECYKQLPQVGIFDSARLSAAQDGKHLAIDLVGEGSKAEEVAEVVKWIQGGIEQIQAQMAQAAKRGPEVMMQESLKPITDFLAGLKLSANGKTAKASARLEASSSSVMMIPAVFFMGVSSSRVMHRRMEMEAAPPPVEEPMAE